MSTLDVDGGVLLDKPTAGFRVGDGAISPEGFRGTVAEFDEDGLVKVVFLAKYGRRFGWYDEGDLVHDDCL